MNVGIGVMAMPSAFYNSGMVVGIAAMIFMAVITVHCMHLLVRHSTPHVRVTRRIFDTVAQNVTK
jgi:amino acid permease